MFFLLPSDFVSKLIVFFGVFCFDAFSFNRQFCLLFRLFGGECCFFQCSWMKRYDKTVTTGCTVIRYMKDKEPNLDKEVNQRRLLSFWVFWYLHFVEHWLIEVVQLPRNHPFTYHYRRQLSLVQALSAFQLLLVSRLRLVLASRLLLVSRLLLAFRPLLVFLLKYQKHNFKNHLNKVKITQVLWNNSGLALVFVLTCIVTYIPALTTTFVDISTFPLLLKHTHLYSPASSAVAFLISNPITSFLSKMYWNLRKIWSELICWR